MRRFFLQGQKRLRAGVQRHDPPLELAHGVHERNFGVQPRLDVGLDHLTKAQLDGAFGLLDDVDRL